MFTYLFAHTVNCNLEGRMQIVCFDLEIRGVAKIGDKNIHKNNWKAFKIDDFCCLF